MVTWSDWQECSSSPSDEGQVKFANFSISLTFSKKYLNLLAKFSESFQRFLVTWSEQDGSSSLSDLSIIL